MLNDYTNQGRITSDEVKEIMNSYQEIIDFLMKYSAINDIYTFIHSLHNMESEIERKEYIKQFTDTILEEAHKERVQLSKEDYKELFKYSSFEEYLKSFHEYSAEKLIEELKALPQDFLFSMPIPLPTIFDKSVLRFMSLYGVKNIVDFDNECGQFFTKNNCEMLKLMDTMYLQYGINVHDENKKIFTQKMHYDENGNYIELPYTKDEFYEAMRRIIVYGPSNGDFVNRAPDYRTITGEFRDRNADLFLSEQAPEELQNAFYTKSITPSLIAMHPEYSKYLAGKDLESCFQARNVMVVGSSSLYGYENLYNFLGTKVDFNSVMGFISSYSDVFDIIFDNKSINNQRYRPIFSIEDEFIQIQKKINESFIKMIIETRVNYPKKIPKSLREEYPTFFLSPDVSQDIQTKFYSRKFALQDFIDNPQLLKIFGNTNVLCGFSADVSWMIPLFSSLDNLEIANSNRLKVVSVYSKIQDVALQESFKEYVLSTEEDFNIEKIEYVSEVLSRLSLSNSSEIFTFRKELAIQILKTDNPLESLSKIEDIFIRNNIPVVGKLYSCFDILHPNFDGFDFNRNTISPILKESSTTSKKIVVFSDLIKASFGSNNRSINAYLRNIEIGSSLYENIRLGNLQYNTLTESEKKELFTFSKHLGTIYNNTMRAKIEKEIFISTGSVLNDILELSKRLSPNGTLDYNLGDRVIKMFCGFAGIDTIEKAKAYVHQKIEGVDSTNRMVASSDMILEQGDFLKGIGDIKYLRNILQNGSVSREYLGSSAGSDATPLDTDVSMIMSSNGNIKEKIEGLAASKYGPIWLVLKNDERFITTRNAKKTIAVKRDMSKLEVFYTGVLGPDHYGIRTGFASSEIDYIMMEEYDPRVGLEIAMNGFYIPIANTEGKIIFTPGDYDMLREKMSGLSYYGEENYTFSPNLVTEEVEEISSQIEQSNYEIQGKRVKINEIIRKSLEELGLQLKTTIDGDLTEGFVELIDTGSTGRGTNKPGDGDFDFMMRLDKILLSNPNRLQQLKQTLLRNLGKENSSELTGTGDFRLKNVSLDSSTTVDIDITFTQKTDKVSYSTDMSLRDRLATIQKNNSEKYPYVVANILLAKKVLKEAGVYKPNRGEIPQGGLGGVGIENWILQNGGSFIDAATSFIEASEGKSFQVFQSIYQIWDFGDNHLAEKRGHYPHDNFVTNNMSEEGFKRMREALKEYLKNIQMNKEESIQR